MVAIISLPNPTVARKLFLVEPGIVSFNLGFFKRDFLQRNCSITGDVPSMLWYILSTLKKINLVSPSEHQSKLFSRMRLFRLQVTKTTIVRRAECRPAIFSGGRVAKSFRPSVVLHFFLMLLFHSPDVKPPCLIFKALAV